MINLTEKIRMKIPTEYHDEHDAAVLLFSAITVLRDLRTLLGDIFIR